MQITYEEYLDKVWGGWVGKCAGGILGAPIEGYKCFNDIEISDKLFETNFANDDLDLQVLWLDMVQKKSVHIQEKDFAQHWINHVGFPWNEYGIASRNLKLGISLPESGRLNNYYWKNSMGCPIRSEIWGMLCPGMPEKAAYYAGLDGSLDHHGFSVEAEQYFSVCASLAFYESDILIVLDKALTYIPQEGPMYQLVIKIKCWLKAGDSNYVMKKIKSYYGDADFTSAPMNIAFTILALLNSHTDFDCIIEALHMGHDSDCIVATAGALIGIIKGYKNIPALWKTRVGEEVLISEAITDIYKPATILELATATCKEGIQFWKYYNEEHVLKSELNKTVVKDNYKINYEYPLWDDTVFNPKQIIRVNFNNDNIHKIISFKLQFDDQIVAEELRSVNADEKVSLDFEVTLPYPKVYQNSFEFKLTLVINDFIQNAESIILPYYGSWLLLGPFIEDNKALIPCDSRFPEHGMSSMPSTIYMNEDKINTDKAFLDISKIEESIATLSTLPYHTDIIHASSFYIPYQNSFYGKGQRTIYLYSYLELTEQTVLWICMGCTSLMSLFVNGVEIYKATEIKRCWPAAHSVLHQFEKGKNTICIRLDIITDESKLEFGLKEFKGEHHHQTQWSTLVPFFTQQ